jgi:two-component system sensor histidine kinase KdpD
LSYRVLVRLGLAERPGWRRVAAGTVASAIAVAVVTGAIALFEPYVPVLSLGVLYVFAVLPIAIVWGLAYALPVAVGSMLAFNWFFLEPRHTLRLADRTNWFALAVYLGTAIVVSELAARSRRRAALAEERERESALLAQLAGELLHGRPLEQELDGIAARAAQVLGIDEARIELGPERHPGAGSPYPLESGRRRVGTLYTSERSAPSLDVRRRFLPALASLLAVAEERERLGREALEAEALRRSDTIKTAVLRAVSHDLRSPLTGIATAIGALRNPTLELTAADRAELLETIDVEKDRLNRLVGDLLDLSRLQAGAAAPEPELWTVEELVRHAVEASSESERIDLVLAEAPLVNVDAAQIERVLANLLDNALKFSPREARVQLRVTATRRDVIVRVVDHGPGLPEAELERVFEPFRHGSDERAGTGLGLAIARGFAEANGARIWAESRPGQGAMFALALPAVETPVELVE